MSGEKTEAPTAKKIKDARQKGQILKSKEIVSSCIIVILLSLLLSLSSFFVEHFLSLFAYLQDSSLLDFSTAKAKIVPHIWHIALNILLPIIIITILIIILSHLAQFGFLLSLSSLKPDIKHINPIAGAKKIFLLKNLLEFFKSLLKVIFIGFIVWFVIKGNINFFFHLPKCGLKCIPIFIGQLLTQLTIICVLGLIIISLLDYCLEYHFYIKQLKMSKEEIKKEYKEMDGNPEIKGRRKQLHKELLVNNIRKQVKQSSVIITNPTHIAIGIRYIKHETPLPIITLKQTDALAQLVKKIAIQENIPIIQRIPLARSLYAEGIIDQYIPENTIETMAEVLHWLIQISQANDYR